MARRSQCSSAGDNPLDPNYLPPHYREEYRLAVDALVEEDLEGYYKFLQKADVVDFLSTPEIQYVQESVQLPQQSLLPEQQFLEADGDGSSDTYWPIHSDLDVPDLDLGWPPQHRFIGPTEVTTLVNPPEPDMPSIKEQARRLIKNAQQVIAVVMDMFTDVDIFADILDAAMRSVAVYIILDEQNVDHFTSMVSNCRVTLQNIQFLRVRTVSGITYHCRSGKSFKGQMMDRFLLTDCRAVLSGNYSFMWSFEKLHRCMAHLFLGQLVATFDEEFRILFAQSQPLMMENVPVEDFGPMPKRQYPSDRTLYREPNKFLSLDTSHPEDRMKHAYDERVDGDRRLMHLRRHESLQTPADMYSRYSSQQLRGDPSNDPVPSRISMMENLAFKRHSYAEGAHGRFSYPFLQQNVPPEPETQGRQFYRGQHPGHLAGPEADTSGYDKFWNQDYQSADQYSESGLQQAMLPPDNFDPVLNYLSSTRNLDFDQSSDKMLLTADLSSQPGRLSSGQPYTCQTSPTPSNPTDQKQFFQERGADRKDPSVKQGLRNWRISSFLSANDSPADEGLPMAPPLAGEAFEEPMNPVQQIAPGVSFPKIPNVREFKVPAIPRASQMPGYIKNTVREQPKKLPDEPAVVAAETKTTPTPSESSSTTEVEKAEEVEQKEQNEPKTTGLRREESFRRNYSAAAPIMSRLRSSLIFSSLDQGPQDAKTAPGQQDEESDKAETDQTKLPFASQVLGQRRSGAREWSHYMKSATFDKSPTETPKPEDVNIQADEKDPSKVESSDDISEKSRPLEPIKSIDVEQPNSSPSLPQPKPPEAQLPKTFQPEQEPKPLLAKPLYVDMSDPDNRLMFFKELAAKRKAEKAAEAEKSKAKAQAKPFEPENRTTLKKEEPETKKMANAPPSEGLSEKNLTAKDAGKTISSVKCESVSMSSETSDKTDIEEFPVKVDSSAPQSCREKDARVVSDTERKEPQTSQPETSLTLSAITESPQSGSPEVLKLSKPAVKESSSSHPTTSTNTTPATLPSPELGTNQGKVLSCHSTSKESSSDTSCILKTPPSSVSAELDSAETEDKSVQPETKISEPEPSAEQLTQSCSADHILSDPSSKITPALPSSPDETIRSNVSPEDSRILPPDSTKPEALQSESTHAHQESVTQSSETPSPVVSAHVEPDLPLPLPAKPNISSLQATPHTKTTSESEPCAPTHSEKEGHESNSSPKTVAEESAVIGPSEDIKQETTPSSYTPSSPMSGLPNVSKSTTNEPPLNEFSQATPPSETNLTECVPATPVEMVSSTSPPTEESVGQVSAPEAEKTETDMSAPCSPSDTPSALQQIAADAIENPVSPSAETQSPTEPTSNTPVEPTSELLPSERHTSEPSEPAENGQITTDKNEAPVFPDPGEKNPEAIDTPNNLNIVTSQDTVSEVVSNEAPPSSPQSKQPKVSQSRYQSSTANVLSSSNLRDDTKLLLEQISANSQSRNEANKESPVTDDEKEDEADKNAKREKERGMRTLIGGESKVQERDKLLERIQSMRKERKVYSRFEMPP